MHHAQTGKNPTFQTTAIPTPRNQTENTTTTAAIQPNTRTIQISYPVQLDYQEDPTYTKIQDQAVHSNYPQQPIQGLISNDQAAYTTLTSENLEIGSVLNTIPTIIPNLNHRITNAKIIVITSEAVREFKRQRQVDPIPQYKQQPQQQQQQIANKINTSRVPFLPHQPPNTFSVKKNQKYIQEEIQNQIPKINRSSNISNCSSVYYSENSKYQNLQAKTLTAMTGIQLADTDLSTESDMSGVVPCATTVEEINVPVFIDERFEAVTHPTFTNQATTEEIIICNKNNQSDKGVYLKDGIFEELEFDIEQLIVNDADKKVDQQQQELYEEDEEEQIQLQSELSQLINNYTNFNNINNNLHKHTKSNNNSKKFDMLNTLFSRNEPKLHLFDDLDLDMDMEIEMEMNEKEDLKLNNDFIDDILPPQYRVLPGALEDSEITCLDSEVELPDDAVDFSLYTTPDIRNMLTNSQENPMLGGGCIANNNRSTAVTGEFWKDQEPFVPEFYEEDDNKNTVNICSMRIIIDANKTTETATVTKTDENILTAKTDEEPILITTTTTTNENTLKRPYHEDDEDDDDNNNNDIKIMKNNEISKQKRKKLNIDVGRASNNIDKTLNTPDIINLISSWGGDEIAVHLKFPQHSPQEVFNTLLFNDDNPETPPSCNSTSLHTNSGSEYTLTAPNSPALSISSNNAATSQYSVSSSSSRHQTSGKKKRGRPAKQHSDLPNPTDLQNLPHNERKRLEDRAKNNEASRLSRQKNKQRELVEIEEENILQMHNTELRQELAIQESIARKLKHALEKKFSSKR